MIVSLVHSVTNLSLSLIQLTALYTILYYTSPYHLMLYNTIHIVLYYYII